MRDACAICAHKLYRLLGYAQPSPNLEGRFREHTRFLSIAQVGEPMALQPPKELLRPYLDLLREVRLEAGLKQVDMARSLGTVQSVVSDYETGERRLDVLELQVVCEVCGVTIGDFISRLEERWSENSA